MLLFSHPTVYNSLWPHGLQHARLPCSSASPRDCSNSCPTESVVSSNHLVLCHPFLLPPSVFPSIKVLSNENNLALVLSLLRKQPIHISASYYFIKDLCIMWAKYWSFSFSISPYNDYSGLISFKIDYFDLLAVQGTVKSLLHHHSLKISVLQCSAFFMVQLSK